ncbi:hypothetical protein QBC46DRAFT_297495 [Diplogelasinospora grovesii]|uniref:2EXR domain-containing protein n=1 Tax=Diplogelasinospora grovesii TaxID=303347 RepID=A0AAN6S0Q1_9PEZI|nr:hypothetical protein QBC46DRAFT_297495 [Diplogelasinospora grovesii]
MNFELLNDSYGDQKAFPPALVSLTSFRFFPSLPPELRLEIWRATLPDQRFLIVRVDKNPSCVEVPYYVSRNELGNVTSSAPYRLCLKSTNTWSPLLAVNRESREVVLKHYRVHIPCNDSLSGECLRFRPETDVVHVQCIDHKDRVAHYFADVVHDARAYDPQNKGILHVAIGGRENLPAVKAMLPAIYPPALHDLARESMVAMLGNLRSLTLVHMIRGDTRLMFSCLELAAPRYNRSIPLHSFNASFDIVPEGDPRPIEPDMDQVLVGHDPRGIYCLWRQMEAALQVPPVPRDMFRVLLTAPQTITFEGAVERISTQAEAKRYVEFEEQAWRGNFDAGHMYRRFGYENPDTPETLERARKMPAFGFWLFPMEAFGDDFDSATFDPIRCPPLLADLRKVRPQLGLFRLPDGPD